MSTQMFRSPIPKLLAFFHRSRNRWKDKCKQAKKELKSLKVCHAKLKASRDYWKQKARQAAAAETAQEGTETSTIKIPPAAFAGRRSASRKASGD